MTIALGVLASDGIVMAADTQEGSGYAGDLKADQSKVITFIQPAAISPRGVCSISGAGHGHYIDCLADELGDVFLHNPMADDDELKGVFQQRLGEFHREHILPFLILPRDERPSVEMLLAVHQGTAARLFTSIDNTIHKEHHPFAAVGAGRTLANILMNKYWRGADIPAIQLLAAYVVFMVKEMIEGCGKYTTVTTIHGPKIVEGGADGPAKLVFPTHPVSHFSVEQVEELEHQFRRNYWGQEVKALWAFIDRNIKRSAGRKMRLE